MIAARFALLLALAGAAGAASEDLDLRWGAGRLRLQLALDQVELRGPQGGPRVAAAVAAADRPGLQVQAAAAARAQGGVALAVAYPPGVPRTEQNRRVITRLVNFQLKPGVEAAAVAAVAPLRLIGEQSFGPRVWLAECLADDLLAAVQVADALASSGLVRWAEPVIEQRMRARATTPNDPLFTTQWHLKNTGAAQVAGGVAGNDINVENVWDTYKGEGVNIAIVDDGLEHAHADLAGNFLALGTNLSHNFRTDRANDNDPAPAAADSHGTMVAGLAAAVGDNATGVTGVAYKANLMGLRLIGGTTETNANAIALAWAATAAAAATASQVWVSNNSWGPSDDGIVADPIGNAEETALGTATSQGRGTRGTVVLFAAGNGGDAGTDDSASYDPYSNCRYVMSVAASLPDGTKAGYSEEGCDVWINAPGGVAPNQGMVSVDRTGADGYDNANDYTTQLNGGGGTSWATPVASGVVALVLQSRPELTWRDVFFLLAGSATQNDAGSPSWQTTSVGLKHSNKYGFGRVNAGQAVTDAATWVLAPEEEDSIQAAATIPSTAIPDNDPAGCSATFAISAPADRRCEAVLVTVNVTHPRRGDLKFTLTDPAGNVATVPRRPNDTTADLASYTFKSVVHVGVPATGAWVLTAIDEVAGNTGTLDSATLTVHGFEPYATPTISGTSTSSIAVGSGNTVVTVSGTGFAKNANHETVMTSVWLTGGAAGAQQLPATISGSSTTALTVTIPAAQLAAAGTLRLSTVNPAFASFGGGGSATSSAIVCNAHPTCTAIADQTTNEDTALAGGTAVAFTVADTETAAGTLVVAASSSNTALVPNGNLVIAGAAGAKTLAITPAANANGSATISVVVTDGGGLSATRAFLVTVTAVNDPPVASANPAIAGTLNVGQALTATPNFNDSADTGTTLTYVYQWQRADDAAGTNLANIGANSSTYTLVAADEAKRIRVVVTATDDGAPGPGLSTTATAAYTAAIGAVLPPAASPTSSSGSGGGCGGGLTALIVAAGALLALAGWRRLR